MRLPPLPTPNTSVRILGSRVDSLSPAAVLTEAEALMKSGKPQYLLTANALMLLEAHKSPSYKSAVEKAALSVPDSSGLTWAAKVLGLPKLERIPGIDLSLQLCARAAENNLGAFFLGGKPGVAERAAAFVKTKYPSLRIAGHRHGFFYEAESSRVIDELRGSQARLFFLAMGMPRQEEWFARYVDRLPAGLYVGVGGTFDVWSGDLKRAPRWFQEQGLEWVYRTFQEPFRLKRIAKLPLFAFLVLKEKWTPKSPQNH